MSVTDARPVTAAVVAPYRQPLLPGSIQCHPFVAFLRSELSDLLPVVSSASVCGGLSVLHGDLFLENVLFSADGRLLGLIDFEEMCLGPRLLDVCMTITGCCYTATHQLDYQLTHSLLSSYCSRHPLTVAECGLLVDFLRYACLAIAFWRFRQFNVRVADGGRRDAYRPMVDRIERLRAADGPDRQIIDRIQHTLSHYR